MKEKRDYIYQLTSVALMAAVMCVISPWAVGIGPVPVSLATIAVYLSVYVLGCFYGTASVCLYILIGIAGLPVFSGGRGGLGVIAGPTGGYIVGYIFMALAGGLLMQAVKRRFVPVLLGWAAATAVLYAFGTAWFIALMKVSLTQALVQCVYPFLPGDAAKIVIGTLLGRAVRSRLLKAGICR